MSAQAPEAALHATDLVVGYPSRGTVLDRVTVRLAAHRATVLLGANGSGKTTLLRTLSGALVPASGTVTVNGHALTHNRRGLATHRRHVQLVLQDPDDQLISADVTQDVSFGPLNLGLSQEETAERVRAALDVLGITHLAQRPTHQLSYGEKKRVAVAGAVAMEPDYLLLDEPTAGMDPDGVDAMLAALDRLTKHGTTVVMSTHNVDLALAWACDAVIMHHGTAVQGAPADLLTDRALVARAHLRTPWPLELAERLGLTTRPRTLDEVVTTVASHIESDNT